MIREAQRKAAWKRVSADKGADGVDRSSVDRFAGGADRYLEEISQALLREDFAVSPVRRVYISKGGGRQRPLGIPTVKDRAVQTALKLVLEPIFEQEFAEESYGFRPARSEKDALRRVDGLLKAGYTWVVDADREQYVDTIDHEWLMQEVERKVRDSSVLLRSVASCAVGARHCGRPCRPKSLASAGSKGLAGNTARSSACRKGSSKSAALAVGRREQNPQQ